MKRMLLGLAGSSVLAASLVTAMAAPASAAGCSGSHLGNWSISGGYISVYYNSATGRNCAMTRTNNPGHSQWIMVKISANGGGSDRDGGYYSYYAGPVYVYARNTCISFMGNVGGGPAEGVTNAYCD